MKVHYWSKGEVWGAAVPYKTQGRGVVELPPYPIMYSSEVARRVKQSQGKETVKINPVLVIIFVNHTFNNFVY